MFAHKMYTSTVMNSSCLGSTYTSVQSENTADWGQKYIYTVSKYCFGSTFAYMQQENTSVLVQNLHIYSDLIKQ